ncbi:IclR family transcriptional regulator [Oricola sp.]|uniref:IclR family transcriptional regulator n=1 Tax=Oricola sp. TaxID=1979950 RepID=UPI003BA97746
MDAKVEQADIASNALEKNKVPAVDRVMAVLAILEQRADGTSIRDLVEALGLPRTTVYRVLNSLEIHGMVRRSAHGSYTLGPRLLSLAARVVRDEGHNDLANLAMPHMRRISSTVRQSVKLSVVDGDSALVIATSASVDAFSLNVAPGQRVPLHAGAAGKVLLAHFPTAEMEAYVTGDLASYTQNTIADADQLRAELDQVRERGWADDHGEFTPNVEAFAAAITDHAGKTKAALSIAFLSGLSLREREMIRSTVITGAGAISADLPPPRVSGA